MNRRAIVSRPAGTTESEPWCDVSLALIRRLRLVYFFHLRRLAAQIASVFSRSRIASFHTLGKPLRP